VPKTPEWAETECGVPARQIRALAREWGRKKTMLAAGGMGGWGGACRAASGNEWSRMMIALAAMQGMGKPGSNIWSTTSGVPFDPAFFFPGYAEGASGDVAIRRKKLANACGRTGARSNPSTPRGADGPAPAFRRR
jgi:trimethylamine-N-oxide reductase (cytochrome c)